MKIKVRLALKMKRFPKKIFIAASFIGLLFSTLFESFASVPEVKELDSEKAEVQTAINCYGFG